MTSLRKPQNRSSSVKNRSNKRTSRNQKQEYITDPEELEIIEAILDDAIAEASDDIEDLREFFKFVEEHSEELAFDDGDTYPLVITCYPERKGQVTGFTVAFSEDTDRYVAGSKIMAGYEDDPDERHKFSPKNISEALGLDHEEKEQSRGTTTRKGRNTESSTKRTKRRAEEEEDTLDTDSDVEEKETRSEKKRTTTEKNTSKSRSSKNSKKQTEEEDTHDLEDDDIEDLAEQDLLEDESGETNFSGALGKVAKNRRKASPQSPNKMKEANDLAETLTTQGNEINGLNLLGTAVTLGIITAEIASKLENTLRKAREEGQDERAESIKEKIEEIVERAEKAIGDYKELQQKAKAKDKSPVQEETQTQEPSNSSRGEPLTETGKDINKLSNDLLDPVNKPIPSLNIEKNDNIEKRLDKIEDYLDKLSKRLDLLEEKIAELKEQLDSQTPIEIQPPTSPKPESTPKKNVTSKFIGNSTTGQVKQDPKIAEALLNYALTTEPQENEGINIGDKTLYVDNNAPGKFLISLESEEGFEIFRGTKTNGKWTEIEGTDNLWENEKNQILSLPQTKEETIKLATAQEFVETLKEIFPKSFENCRDFKITEPGERKGDPDIVLYNFQLDRLKDEAKILEGTDPKGALVFKAELKEGRAPEIKKCGIPTEEMEEVISAHEEEKEKNAEKSRRRGSLERRHLEENQSQDQL